jgi:protein farnesyltransferase subunit beta
MHTGLTVRNHSQVSDRQCEISLTFRYLDVPSLTNWLSARQKAPDSGFAGRTNKLVDGCYSGWVGGCWSLLAPALGNGQVEDDNYIWSREGLARYVLCCSQPQRQPPGMHITRKGGFRDKPGKPVDSYHSNYCLVGVGALQTVAEYVDTKTEADTKFPLETPYNWRLSTAKGPWEGDDLVHAVHPVFVIPPDKALACRKYFEENFGFR